MSDSRALAERCAGQIRELLCKHFDYGPATYIRADPLQLLQENGGPFRGGREEFEALKTNVQVLDAALAQVVSKLSESGGMDVGLAQEALWAMVSAESVFDLHAAPKRRGEQLEAFATEAIGSLLQVVSEAGEDALRWAPDHTAFVRFGQLIAVVAKARVELLGRTREEALTFVRESVRAIEGHALREHLVLSVVANCAPVLGVEPEALLSSARRPEAKGALGGGGPEARRPGRMRVGVRELLSAAVAAHVALLGGVALLGVVHCAGARITGVAGVLVVLLVLGGLGALPARQLSPWAFLLVPSSLLAGMGAHHLRGSPSGAELAFLAVPFWIALVLAWAIGKAPEARS